uniref:Immunodominant membrane protein n=1 Tax=Korean potato witches'-broom phytoplasma TaxID=573073 RepID=B9X100_9MOLU|nr:immunodominant membrane protein [Korean potato witches'-broom phytoplasma]
MSKMKDFVQSKNGKITIGVIVAVVVLTSIVAMLYFFGVFGGGKALDKKLIENFEKKIAIPSDVSKYDDQDKIKKVVKAYEGELTKITDAIDAHNKKAKDADKIKDEVKNFVNEFKNKVTTQFQNANDAAKFKTAHGELEFSKFITDLKQKLGDIVTK